MWCVNSLSGALVGQTVLCGMGKVVVIKPPGPKSGEMWHVAVWADVSCVLMSLDTIEQYPESDGQTVNVICAVRS